MFFLYWLTLGYLTTEWFLTVGTHITHLRGLPTDTCSSGTSILISFFLGKPSAMEQKQSSRNKLEACWKWQTPLQRLTLLQSMDQAQPAWTPTPIQPLVSPAEALHRWQRTLSPAAIAHKHPRGPTTGIPILYLFRGCSLPSLPPCNTGLGVLPQGTVSLHPTWCCVVGSAPPSVPLPGGPTVWLERNPGRDV